MAPRFESAYRVAACPAGGVEIKILAMYRLSLYPFKLGCFLSLPPHGLLHL